MATAKAIAKSIMNFERRHSKAKYFLGAGFGGYLYGRWHKYKARKQGMKIGYETAQVRHYYKSKKR